MNLIMNQIKLKNQYGRQSLPKHWTSIPRSILCNSQIKIFHDAKILTNMYNTKYMIFTTIGSDVVIQLANLPLLILLTPLALTCHAMVTRWSRTERTVLIEVDIVVKRKSTVVQRGQYCYRKRYLSSQMLKFVVESRGAVS